MLGKSLVLSASSSLIKRRSKLKREQLGSSPNQRRKVLHRRQSSLVTLEKDIGMLRYTNSCITC